MNASIQPTLPGSRPGTVLVPQGALTRGPAFLIDTLLVSLFAALLLGARAPLTEILLVTLAAEFVYFSVCEGAFGTTLGKRIFGLRVVRAADGRPCGPFAAVVRTALRLVDNVLFSLPGVTAIVLSPRRQRLGDRAARTLVVSEVPEHLLKVLWGLSGGASADEMARRLDELVRQQQTTMGDAVGDAPDPVIADELVPCPFCNEPMVPAEIVCRRCGHYVNQVSAHGQTDDLAPVPQLYADDRNHRFDALWRLVFAGDEESLTAVRTAVPAWSQADRLLAVQSFSEVADTRALAFLDFMTSDPEPSVRALARATLSRSSTHDAD